MLCGSPGTNPTLLVWSFLIVHVDLCCAGGSHRIVMNFSNKLILAPMVRGSKLPMRLLALKYGAGLVYTDEIIDVSLLTAQRSVNGKVYDAILYSIDAILDLFIEWANNVLCAFRRSDVLGTVDYVNETNGYVLFRTAPSEKDKLVFQMGTSNPNRAVKLGKFVQDDVSAVGNDGTLCSRFHVTDRLTFVIYYFPHLLGMIRCEHGMPKTIFL